ncbi:ATP-grasp domain-containing protein [Methylophilus aquaticus]|uniref:ATP-grasp domain-containing protein n=1 Tax=Methylophilus aquaticus TaxID=1971610 RepID=A0ABT9JRD1_9PROT|nr:ATP-grasp domain-containing protein [Methylophilus aquaticus]MDP8567112.1 ATP-grasp domain-containing protein [Methylophilus aquaticus]
MQNNARLKIWVCEFISAGGLASQALPASLLQEGVLMRDALLADLSALAVDCITSHDVRVASPVQAGVNSQPIGDQDAPWQVWQQQLQDAEITAVWVIAPETDGILLRLQMLVAEAGKRWIGCHAEAIAVATSKARMAERCAQQGIAVIPHQYLQKWTASAQLPEALAWVVKPDDGAGCEYSYYVELRQQVSALKKYFMEHLPERYPAMLIQPYIAGQALSMSVIATTHAVKVIAAHTQQIAVIDGQLRFQGAGVHHASQHLSAMQALAGSIHRAIPGLIGYWGADMILTEESRLVLVEINPRLTTPYIALSGVLDYNPAGAILSAVFDQQLPSSVANDGCTLQLLPVTITKMHASNVVCHG